MDKERNKNNVNNEYIELVRLYVRKLNKDGLPVDAAFIFGSTSRGTRNKWSDIDTCIISKKFGDDRLSNRVFLMKEASSISDLIEPHPMSPEDFEDKYNPLASEVKKWGVRVEAKF